MKHFRAALLALGFVVTVSAAHAQTRGFIVVCKDGISVPGSADSTACAFHGGARTIETGRNVRPRRFAKPAPSSAVEPPMPPR